MVHSCHIISKSAILIHLPWWADWRPTSIASASGGNFCKLVQEWYVPYGAIYHMEPYHMYQSVQYHSSNHDELCLLWVRVNKSNSGKSHQSCSHSHALSNNNKHFNTQAFCCLHLDSCVFDAPPKKMSSYQTMSCSSWLGTVTYQSTPAKRKSQEVMVVRPPGEMWRFPWYVVRVDSNYLSTITYSMIH